MNIVDYLPKFEWVLHIGQTSPKQREMDMSCRINSSLRLQAVYFRLTSPPDYPTPGRSYVTYRQDM